MKDENTESVFDCSMQLSVQMKLLKSGCEKYISSGDRSIYKSEGQIIKILNTARVMGSTFPERFATKFHQMIKETSQNGFVNETLNSKGACPSIKKAIENALGELAQGGYSVPTVAMALIIKGITITKKGVGTNDQVDYTKKFNIQSPNTLYLEWNSLSKDPIGQKNYKKKAEELIKNEGL